MLAFFCVMSRCLTNKMSFALVNSNGHHDSEKNFAGVLA